MLRLTIAACLLCSATVHAQERSWVDDIRLNAFADGFYMVDWNRPEQPNAASDVSHRAFDERSGFMLSFAGVGLKYEGEQAGAVLELYFGRGMERLIGNANPVLSTVRQAYASWIPLEGLRFDVGHFTSPFGLETAESYANMNYTRGATYFLVQPAYHVGLRVTGDIGERFQLVGFLANGTDTPVDENITPHIGVMGTYSADEVSIALGYYTGAGSSGLGDASDPTSNDDWEHLIEAMLWGEFGRVQVGVDLTGYLSGPDSGSSLYWGLSLGSSVRIIDPLRLALRYEILQDPDQYVGDGWEWLMTTTFTIDVQPVENVFIRLDTRFEWADESIFTNQDGPLSSQTWVSSVLGLAVTTDPNTP